MKPLRVGAPSIAALTVLALAVVPSTASASTAVPSAKSPSPVGITLESQPAWVTPGRPTSVVVQVTEPPHGGIVETQLHDAVSTRDQLRQARAGRALGPVLTSLQPKRINVAAGTTQTRVQLQVPLTDRSHPLAGAPCANGCHPGVYPVDIQVHDATGQTQARLDTFLLLLPPAATPLTTQPLLHVGLVVPISSNPTLRLDGRRVLPGSARQRLARILTTLTTPSGSLLRSTLAPSPELVQTLATNDTSLRDRLVAAAGAPAGRVLSPPFVPFDQPAWARQPALTALSAEQVTTGRSITAALDPTHSPDTGTWIAGSDIDNEALPQLGFQGFTHLLVPNQALPDTSDGSTLTRPFRLSGDPTGKLQAVVADSALRDEAGAPDSLLGVQTLLADLTIISQESSRSDRGVAVVLPDQWNPSNSALDQLVAALTSQPPGTRALVLPVTVDQLFASASGPSSASGGGASGVNSSSSTGEQLATRQLIGDPRSAAGFAARVVQTSQLMNAYRATFAGASSSPGAVGAGLARWADLDARVRTAGYAGFSDATRARYLNAVDSSIADDLGRISVPQRQTITLTSRSGKIPFTIRNGTGAPIQVMVAVESNERVTFPSTQQFVTVPGEVSRIDFHVRTRTSGDTPVQVKIWTPDGSTEIGASRITVRSTAVSGVGLVLTIGAGAFLLVWWLSHWRRSRKRRANAPAANPPTPPRGPAAPTAAHTHGSTHTATMNLSE